MYLYALHQLSFLVFRLFKYILKAANLHSFFCFRFFVIYHSHSSFPCTLFSYLHPHLILLYTCVFLLVCSTNWHNVLHYVY